MKKSVILLLLVLLSVPGIVSASSDENISQKRRETAAQIQEVNTPTKVERSVKVKIASNHAARLKKRFDAYYNRLTDIITRFEKRLAFLKENGKSVTSLETTLASIKTQLASAKAKGDSAVAAFNAIPDADRSTQKAQLNAAKALAEEARTLYKEVLTSLKKALKSLKMIVKPALPAASAAVNNAL
jgi:septation ring formation regulator EzrA